MTGIDALSQMVKTDAMLNTFNGWCPKNQLDAQESILYFRVIGCNKKTEGKANLIGSFFPGSEVGKFWQHLKANYLNVHGERKWEKGQRTIGSPDHTSIEANG